MGMGNGNGKGDEMDGFMCLGFLFFVFLEKGKRASGK